MYTTVFHMAPSEWALSWPCLEPFISLLAPKPRGWVSQAKTPGKHGATRGMSTNKSYSVRTFIVNEFFSPLGKLILKRKQRV